MAKPNVKYVVINGVAYPKATTGATAKAKTATPNQKQKSINWFEKKLGIKAEKTGLKIRQKVKDGVKTYNGVKFNNGRYAVFIKGENVLKYCWDKVVLQ